MPKEMVLIKNVPGANAGHSTTCREEGAYYIQRWVTTPEGAFQTKMDISLRNTTEESANARVEVLRKLLDELEARTSGITFEVLSEITTGFYSRMIVTVIERWIDKTGAGWGWWWSSLLQRIVLTSINYSSMGDIASALALSSGIASDQWGSRGTRLGTIKAWDDVLLGQFNAAMFVENGGVNNGIFHAHTRGGY